MRLAENLYKWAIHKSYRYQLIDGLKSYFIEGGDQVLVEK